MQNEGLTNPAETLNTAALEGNLTSDIITVVRDPRNPLGKRFTRNPDGTLSKQPSVNMSCGLAVMRRVETREDLAELLSSVGDDPHAAIINAVFDGIDVGEEFLILSARELEEHLGIPMADREKQKGVHQITYKGKQYKATGRFKENVRPSCWQLLDRDIDVHTPPQFANLSFEDWFLAVGKILPGLDKTSYVKTESTSARVVCDGAPVGGGNGHVWIKMANREDVERIRTALIICAAQAGLAWKKPKFSKQEEGRVVGNSLATLIDPSVWTPGRLIFCGQPCVGEGLTIVPVTAVVHHGECDALVTESIVLPDAKVIRAITRKAGVEMSVTTDSDGSRIATNDLTLATEIETKDHGILSVRGMIERGFTGKQRCQTPFRESNSYAAFYSVNAAGKPFVYDVGTTTTHWLNDFEAEDAKLIQAKTSVEKLLQEVKEDGAVVLEEGAVAALAAIKQASPSEYQRKRAALKQANRQVSVTALDSAVKSRLMEAGSAQTHHGYATCLLARLTESEWPPVAWHLDLYVVNLETAIWERKPFEVLIRLVAEMHDGKAFCSRRSEYLAVALHAILLATDDSFFSEGPTGLACPGGFYQISGEELKIEPLTPNHRQRVMLPFDPKAMPMPLFEKFRHETFEAAPEHAGEEQQQLALVQEIAGGIMFGLTHRYQVAILFFEPFGRAGKGTVERLLRALVPKEFVTAISPFDWSRDYHVATLAGKRLNVVGELPQAQPIPAAHFKTVIGGDLITGRHPTERPVSFTNDATHLFMSNHMITTKDQSEAFFARWKIVEFPNSRLRSGLPLDANLAQRIIDNELSGIAYWALEGAVRLLRNGKFSASTAHDRLMAKWRRSTNSLEEFIHECCDILRDSAYRRSRLYEDYSEWCSENGRKPFSKSSVKELLAHNVGLGIRLTELNGHETFRGIRPKPTPETTSQSGSYGPQFFASSDDSAPPLPDAAPSDQADDDAGEPF
ncbi:MAG TPA: phage/plasmid primase, P4 family [Candidatus Accumulibacter phosphatis]|nr:phage/plasmid primase, P4 family [Candidatus Accumulibacter phosphatis]